MNGRFKLKESLAAILNVGLGYLKSMLIFFGINFVVMTVCFYIFGVAVPPLIALGICLLDILPVIGSGVVFVPWTIVCFIGGHTTLGIQLAVLYIGLIVVRQVLEPFIVWRNIGVRPLVTFVARILGLFVLGPIGVIVGPVIAAVLHAVYRVHMRVEEQPKRNIRE